MNPQQPDIFTRLGMASASETDKQQLAEQLADLTMVRVMAKVSQQVGPAAMAEIDQLVESNQSDQVDARLRQLVPDFDQLVEVTAREAADQLVADQQAVLAQARQMASTQ